MDRFSELISNGVAAFNHTPVADSMSCPVCREYNNIFSIATDTHMACLEDGRKVITGHLIADKEKFDTFIWSCQFMGVDFRHSKVNCFAQWMDNHGYKGEYSSINGDVVYIVSDRTSEDDPEKVGKIIPTPTVFSYTTESNHIPVSVRFLSRRGDIEDLNECFKQDIYETVKAMNEHRYIIGNQWGVAHMSDGPHIIGNISGQNCILS